MNQRNGRRKVAIAVVGAAVMLGAACTSVGQQQASDNDDYEKSQAAFEDAKEVALGGANGIVFFAASSSHEWSSYRWDVISIGWIDRTTDSGKRARNYVARRLDGDRGGTIKIAWADGATCPQLTEVAEALPELPSPHIDLPVMSFDERPTQLSPGGPSPDGTSIELWGTGMSADGQQWGHIRIGTKGGPIGSWRLQAVANLHGCWATSPITD